MTTEGLMPVAAVAELIREGHYLSLAGDEAALRQLPLGHWIGGTIPYFMAATGGTVSRDQVFVQPVTGFAAAPRLRLYDAGSLPQLCRNAPDHGFSLLIVPAFSTCHGDFARNAPNYEDMYLKPLAGWVAGTHLDDAGHATPQVVLGSSGEFSAEHAVVMDVELPPERFAQIDIVNPFKPGDGDAISFPDTGFSVDICRVNGEAMHLADYLCALEVDTRLPLVADYCGASVNVSIKHIDAAARRVEFYAPVFPGLTYRLAIASGESAPPGIGGDVSPMFACNCILNFLYEGLEGQPAGALTGPATFGEIGYQLLNQTQVVLTIR
ncbi:MAG TPA: hypothetical protein PK620_07085 [Denitromonas sp.]|uniref:DUF6976 family protein n=1 Tax=Denitromonas sp. TaxID=2734609 RepID=UPI001D37DE50|nr:hypothetical protein [Rhodocyclaceae bacterium]MCP5222895.1 hypothetical protein [Zoogloeaceae bacterium]HPR06348.1 hypothetical protein [Denitromonas sp.]HQU88682.1 hypothetical protein [Denitromonas sp.]HQV14664.1 hypothetical protein [Denitromonas sp.]